MGHDVVRLLWTGGWDSTYRLLNLVVREKAAVEPNYLAIRGRHEIDTMEKLRSLVAKHSKETASLIRPLRVHERVEVDAETQKAFESVRARARVGTQYRWLRAWAKTQDVGHGEIEMSVHVDDPAFDAIADQVEPMSSDEGAPLIIRKDARPDVLALFAPFRFPLLSLTKVEMGRDAANMGVLEVMNNTWFCHYPTKSGKPCGLCNPCRFAMIEGMSHRVPWPNRIYGYMPKRVTNGLLRLKKAIG